MVPQLTDAENGICTQVFLGLGGQDVLYFDTTMSPGILVAYKEELSGSKLCSSPRAFGTSHCWAGDTNEMGSCSWGSRTGGLWSLSLHNLDRPPSWRQVGAVSICSDRGVRVLPGASGSGPGKDQVRGGVRHNGDPGLKARPAWGRPHGATSEARFAGLGGGPCAAVRASGRWKAAHSARPRNAASLLPLSGAEAGVLRSRAF